MPDRLTWSIECLFLERSPGSGKAQPQLQGCALFMPSPLPAPHSSPPTPTGIFLAPWSPHTQTENPAIDLPTPPCATPPALPNPSLPSPWVTYSNFLCKLHEHRPGAVKVWCTHSCHCKGIHGLVMWEAERVGRRGEEGKSCWGKK